MAAPFCPECGTEARLTTGAEIYPNLRELADKPMWKCAECPDAHVGCHPGTRDPLGTPAGPQLRAARRTLHRDMIDPLWTRADLAPEYGPKDDGARRVIQRAARGRVYAYLAAGLDLTADECHVGMFDLVRCREAWVCLRGVTYSEIRAWAKAQPPSAAQIEKAARATRKAERDAKKAAGEVKVQRGGKRRNIELPAPTEAERGAAAIAAMALRAAIADPEARGQPFTAHLDYSRPRRAEWVTTWENLPGLTRINGMYLHDLLPGWQYSAPELELEMAPDLEALAEHGIRPTVATSQGVAA